jgi:hypothetical protein
MTASIAAVAQDLRYAARGLRKSSGFALTAVLTLAIGIGATTAVFSVINGILLRPLPYPDSDRLVAVSNIFRDDPSAFGLVSGTDVANWKADNRVFEQLEFVSHPDIVAMSGAGYGERVAVQHMSAEMVPLLGIKAFIGTLPPTMPAKAQIPRAFSSATSFGSAISAAIPRCWARTFLWTQVRAQSRPFSLPALTCSAPEFPTFT